MVIKCFFSQLVGKPKLSRLGSNEIFVLNILKIFNTHFPVRIMAVYALPRKEMEGRESILNLRWNLVVGKWIVGHYREILRGSAWVMYFDPPVTGYVHPWVIVGPFFVPNSLMGRGNYHPVYP